MTTTSANIGPKVVKSAIAVVVLVVVVMVVISYWGTYQSSKEDQSPAIETTATVDATATPDAEGSPEGGEGEGGEEAAESESKGTVIVLIDGLNFRTGPSKSGDLISGLDEGVKLEYLETADGWYKVRTSDGKVGYVSASTQYTELNQ